MESAQGIDVIVKRALKYALMVFTVCCVCASARAQDKSARSYYEDARQAGTLPPLPYVCFRSTWQVSTSPGRTFPYTDPTFAMMGTSQQIAEIMQRKAQNPMSPEEQQQAERIRSYNWLYLERFDHGVNNDSHIFALQNPKDPSRTDWVSKATYDRHRDLIKLDFKINWSTLRFTETLTTKTDAVTYFGQCEQVSR